MPRWNVFTQFFRGDKARVTSSSSSDHDREPEKAKKTNASPATSTDKLPTYRALEFSSRQGSATPSEVLDATPPPDYKRPPPRFPAAEKRHDTVPLQDLSTKEKPENSVGATKSRFKIPANLARMTWKSRNVQGGFIFQLATPGSPRRLGAMVWFTFRMASLMKHVSVVPKTQAILT